MKTNQIKMYQMYQMFQMYQKKIIKILVALFLSFYCVYCAIANAAAPITHVVLAQKWLAQYEQYNDEQKRSFMLGTLFPDIRYLGVVSRNKTHEKDVTVRRLLQPQTEFVKGKRLHALVDRERERMVVKWKIYQKIKHVPGQKHKALFLKLLEDEILFNRQDWKDIRRYLTYVHPEEIAFGIKEDMIKKWHNRQWRAFKSSPSEYLGFLAMLGRGFAGAPKEVVAEWSRIIPKLAKDPEMQKYVDRMLVEFDKVFAVKS